MNECTAPRRSRPWPLVALLVSATALAGCTNVAFGQGGPLISGHSPADAGMGANSEPQPINSLPPGAEGIGGGPNARAPNDLSITIGRGY